MHEPTESSMAHQESNTGKCTHRHNRGVGHFLPKRCLQNCHAFFQLRPTAGRFQPNISETASPARRHTVSQRTHNRKNMTKQTRSSKSKRALSTDAGAGNTEHIYDHTLTPKLVVNPNTAINEIIPRLWTQHHREQTQR